MNPSPTEAATVVDRQLAAYNAHDLDAFLATYAADVEVEGRDGGTTTGLSAVAARYGDLFAQGRCRAEISARVCEGAWVVDRETAHGLGDEPITVLVAYRVRNGLIDRVRFMT